MKSFTAIMTKIINGIKENKKEFITLFQESIEPGKAKIEEISTGKGKQKSKKKKQKKKTKNKKTQKGGASRHSANHRLKPYEDAVTHYLKTRVEKGNYYYTKDVNENNLFYQRFCIFLVIILLLLTITVNFLIIYPTPFIVGYFYMHIKDPKLLNNTKAGQYMDSIMGSSNPLKELKRAKERIYGMNYLPGEFK